MVAEVVRRSCFSVFPDDKSLTDYLKAVEDPLKHLGPQGFFGSSASSAYTVTDGRQLLDAYDPYDPFMVEERTGFTMTVKPNFPAIGLVRYMTRLGAGVAIFELPQSKSADEIQIALQKTRDMFYERESGLEENLCNISTGLGDCVISDHWDSARSTSPFPYEGFENNVDVSSGRLPSVSTPGGRWFLLHQGPPLAWSMKVMKSAFRKDGKPKRQYLVVDGLYSNYFAMWLVNAIHMNLAENKVTDDLSLAEKEKRSRLLLTFAHLISSSKYEELRVASRLMRCLCAGYFFRYLYGKEVANRQPQVDFDLEVLRFVGKDANSSLRSEMGGLFPRARTDFFTHMLSPDQINDPVVAQYFRRPYPVTKTQKFIHFQYPLRLRASEGALALDDNDTEFDPNAPLDLTLLETPSVDYSELSSEDLQAVASEMADHSVERQKMYNNSRERIDELPYYRERVTLYTGVVDFTSVINSHRKSTGKQTALFPLPFNEEEIILVPLKLTPKSYGLPYPFAASPTVFCPRSQLSGLVSSFPVITRDTNTEISNLIASELHMDPQEKWRIPEDLKHLKEELCRPWEPLSDDRITLSRYRVVSSFVAVPEFRSPTLWVGESEELARVQGFDFTDNDGHTKRWTVVNIRDDAVKMMMAYIFHVAKEYFHFYDTPAIAIHITQERMLKMYNFPPEFGKVPKNTVFLNTEELLKAIDFHRSSSDKCH